MVLALSQLAEAEVYLPAQEDVPDTTNYTPGQGLFSLSIKKRDKFETLIHQFLICWLSTPRANLRINNEYITSFLFSYLLGNRRALQMYCIAELCSTKSSYLGRNIDVRQE